MSAVRRRFRRAAVPARLLLLVSSPFLFAGCSAPPPEPPSLAEQALAIAALFETPQPYSAQTMDSLDYAAFFAKHPGYRTDSASVVDFYRRRDMQFAWIVRDSLTESAEAFVALAAVTDSTDSPATAPGPSLSELYDQAFTGEGHIPVCDSCATDVELRLTAEFFRFADRRYGGYLSRDLRDLNWFIPRGKKDVSRLLDSLAVGTMDLSAYEPIHPQYQLLKASIKRNRELADVPWPALNLPEGRRKLEPDDSVEMIGLVRHRLHLLVDLEDDGASERYDSTLVAAVERCQTRHGLEPDGVIGPAFLGAINVPLAERLRTMLVNMERLRWVPEQQPPNLMVVNIPEFRLHVYEGGVEVLSMDVVVGTSATRTVIFSDTLAQVVFSPTWTVPSSITKNEILPAISRDPGYLRKHDMEIIGGSASSPVIRQRPGANNALGRVKFLFPNSYNIYMHDTPSQSGFGREQRTFSHGCIRLSRPRELAEHLLKQDPQWTPEAIGRAMNSGRETTVQLSERRPVNIVYFTAWVDGEGQLNFRDDVYGHDSRLASELFLNSDEDGPSR